MRYRIAVVACVAAVLLVPAGPAAAEVSRLDGDDNVDAAIAFSQVTFPDGAETVLLGRSDVFPDSLSSGGAQGAGDGSPLLLTPPGELDERVRDELDRLDADSVILLGGPEAITPGVADALADEGYAVDRVFGPTRTETAIEVARRFHPQANRAILARSGGEGTQAFADSLGAGAYAANEQVPVLLTETERLTATTRDYLAASAIGSIVVAGGTAAIGEAVATEVEGLGIAVTRVAGPTRVDTAAELVFAQYAQPVDLVVVDGEDPDAWASGFAAAALTARDHALLLTRGDDAPAATVAAILGIKADLVCAPSVSDDACTEVDAASSSAAIGTDQAPLAVMSGTAEVPGPGHPTATGAADVHATDYRDILCYSYSVDEAITLTGAHIHEAPEGEAGDIVVPLSTETTPFGRAADCATGLDEGLVRDILDDPADYYVNLHTAEYPDGALRGQLFAPSAVTQASLSGQPEVPGPGSPDGFGLSTVIGTQDPSELCAGLYYSLDQPATGAHIHEAPVGEAGDIVVELAFQDDGAVTACQDDLDEDLVADILEDPADYYVNVHTEQFPQGAIRGQLQPFVPFEVD